MDKWGPLNQSCLHSLKRKSYQSHQHSLKRESFMKITNPPNNHPEQYHHHNILACSISENLENKSSGMDQSKTSKFSLILASFVLFGSTLWPICSPQRRATCAGVLPSFSATVTKIGFLSTSLLSHVVPGEPNGEYPYKKNNSFNKNSRSRVLNQWSHPPSIIIEGGSVNWASSLAR